jgi:galactose mutarotase-like enzyme
MDPTAAPRYSVSRETRAGGVAVVFLRDAAAHLVVGVAPALGAELCSLCFRGTELLHRALDFAPAPAAEPGAWYGHGQLLFPAVGRCRDGTYSFPPGAPPRAMSLHGFASAAPFAELSSGAEDADDGERGGAELVCVLDSREVAADSAVAAAASSFPFSFRLEVRFRLRGGVLRAAHRVMNVEDSTSGALLPFSIGNHISLAFPFEPARAGALWASGRLLSNLTHEHLLTPGSLLSGEVAPRAELSSAGGLPLTAPCATNGVLGFGPGAGAEALLGPCSLMLVQPGGISVEVAHSVSPPAGPAQRRPGGEAGGAAACSWEAAAASRHFVLWGTPPAAPGERGFICPEPWVGGPDALNTLRGLMVLRGGEECTWEFCVAPSAGAEAVDVA